MRDYDPAIARWTGVDPVIHHSQSPYNAFDGNPVFWADPSGADGVGGWTSSSSFGSTFETPNSTGMNYGYGICSAFGSFAENVGSAWGDGGLLPSNGTTITIDWSSLGSKTVLDFNNGQISSITSFFLKSFVSQVGPIESDWATALEHKYAGMSFGPQPGQGAAIADNTIANIFIGNALFKHLGTALGGLFGRTSGTTTEASGSVYSVAYETTLSNKLYPGGSYYSHFKAANTSLSNAMASDVAFSRSMSNLGVSIPRSATGNILGKSPTNWVWHHNVETGVMQLVPKTQHTPGSIFWDTMHPNGVGGMATWNK